MNNGKIAAAETQDNSTVPELIVKLCKYLAQDSEDLVSELTSRAFKMLAQVSNLEVLMPSDEPYIVNKLRQHLKYNPSNLEQFDLLYSSLAQSDIIQNRVALLSFFYNLTESCSLGPLSKIPSQESISVKQIFHKRLTSSTATASSVLRASSQATTISWSHNDITPSSKSSIASHSSITEHELLEDVFYSLQGIDGKFLRKEPGGLGYTLEPRALKSISAVQRTLVDRITGMSFLHNQLKQYCTENEKQINGAICQAFIATLQSELTEYYKTIGILRANSSNMTLRRVLVALQEPRIRFEWLAYIAEQCNNKKGGALITAVHGFLQHGSKSAMAVSEQMLKAVCKPLYRMLARWLLDGEINDPCNEFLIEVKHGIPAARLWDSKYEVRKAMVPSFISMEQAKIILAAGKSINFLTHICEDTGELPGREILHKLFNNTSTEALFKPEQSIEFHSTLEGIYKETSFRVLDLLRNKFKLYEHLQSLRRYLLLGQGDFIRHLLELLTPELNKSASEIHYHTLSAILESAISNTNAQFEDEDTLKRLNISFMKHSIGDKGWDIFSLVYIVDGPIGTIFQSTLPIYQSLFGALWKAKRTEYVLANIRSQQLSMRKEFRKIRELKAVMHGNHILTSKMIHFLHQTQYYFLFEVLECSWDEMLHRVDKAECLDNIITAHLSFLASVKKGVLLDESSRQLFSFLISVYNFVITLEAHQQTIYKAASQENQSYLDYRAKAENTMAFKLTTKDEEEAKIRVAKFRQFLKSMKLEVSTTAQAFEDIVTQFLKLLASSSNIKLQLLSVRLNFNNFYKLF
ncbi:unnamed protein product [Ceutorhynchus assimilis]|uniref:Gamma-tubulin complex component n=1 Tax=Ceutorhynchus assimilis TaxID=467358 RepID=A0A9N9QL64_9CUCU|nr:unnamed protein product [Ceutorhynchus assimilis]